MDFITIVLVFVAAVCFYLFASSSRKNKANQPPRPFTIPFVGTIGILAPKNQTNRNKYLREISQKLGPIFRIQIGRDECYIVTSYDLFREANIEKPLEFVSRSTARNTVVLTNPQKLGIMDGDGLPAYMAYRRFVLVKLRSLGFGQRSMEHCILRECEALTSEIVKNQENPAGNNMTLRDLLSATTANIIFSILSSERYDYNDLVLTHITRTATKYIDETTFVGIMSGFPILAHLTSNAKRIVQYNNELHVFVRKLIVRHVATLPSATDDEQEAHEARDFIDVFLFQRRKQLEAGQNETFTLDMLEQTIEDLFLGGFETTATTVQWLLLIMLHFPELQQRIHAEIDELCGQRPAVVQGDKNLIVLSDQEHLPLTVATLWEVWRLYPIAPSTLPHAAVSDGATLGGYNVDKGKTILFHIWSIHQDTKLWYEPEKFCPDRFLERQDDGKLMFKQPEHVVAFSAGRRSCIGEQLARKEAFLVFANLMQEFQIRRRPNDDLPQLKERPGVVMYPPEFEVDFVRRQKQ